MDEKRVNGRIRWDNKRESPKNVSRGKAKNKIVQRRQPRHALSCADGRALAFMTHTLYDSCQDIRHFFRTWQRKPDAGIHSRHELSLDVPAVYASRYLAMDSILPTVQVKRYFGFSTGGMLYSRTSAAGEAHLRRKPFDPRDVDIGWMSSCSPA